MSTPISRGQRLAAEAAEAAEVRDALTHPDVVALRVERLRGLVDRFIWAGMILGLLFTMTNVQQFTAHTINADPGSLGWWAAWLLDPTVSVILLGVLLAEREVSRWQVPVGPWARAAKWSLLTATYVMNTWESYAAGSLSGIVLHSVPPLAVFMAAEAVTDCQDKLTEAVHRAHTWASERAQRKAQADRRAKQATTEPCTLSPASLPEPVNPAPEPSVPAAGERPVAPAGERPGWQAVTTPVNATASVGDRAPRPADERRRSVPRKRGARPARRKFLADYLAEARAAWTPQVVVTPAWVREVTSCSRGLSPKVAAALAADLPATAPTTTTRTEDEGMAA